MNEAAIRDLGRIPVIGVWLAFCVQYAIAYHKYVNRRPPLCLHAPQDSTVKK